MTASYLKLMSLVKDMLVCPSSEEFAKIMSTTIKYSNIMQAISFKTRVIKICQH